MRRGGARVRRRAVGAPDVVTDFLGREVVVVILREVVRALLGPPRRLERADKVHQAHRFTLAQVIEAVGDPLMG